MTALEEQLEDAIQDALEARTEIAYLKHELEAERFSAKVAWTIIKLLAAAGGIYAGWYWTDFF